MPRSRSDLADVVEQTAHALFAGAMPTTLAIRQEFRDIARACIASSAKPGPGGRRSCAARHRHFRVKPPSYAMHVQFSAGDQPRTRH